MLALLQEVRDLPWPAPRVPARSHFGCTRSQLEVDESAVEKARTSRDSRMDLLLLALNYDSHVEDCEELDFDFDRPLGSGGCDAEIIEELAEHTTESIDQPPESTAPPAAEPLLAAEPAADSDPAEAAMPEAAVAPTDGPPRPPEEPTAAGGAARKKLRSLMS